VELVGARHRSPRLPGSSAKELVGAAGIGLEEIDGAAAVEVQPGGGRRVWSHRSPDPRYVPLSLPPVATACEKGTREERECHRGKGKEMVIFSGRCRCVRVHVLTVDRKE
jgi:hypothetical protein